MSPPFEILSRSEVSIIFEEGKETQSNKGGERAAVVLALELPFAWPRNCWIAVWEALSWRIPQRVAEFSANRLSKCIFRSG